MSRKQKVKITGNYYIKNYTTIYIHRDVPCLSETHSLICWNCQSKNAENDNFCLDCGKLLHNLPSADQVDPNFNKIFNISRKDLTSKEFTVTDNYHRKFTIQPKSRPHEQLYTLFSVGSLYVIIGVSITISFTIFRFNPFFGLDLMIVPSIGLIAFIIFPFLENGLSYTEIVNGVQNQLIGKVKFTGIIHHSWIFTTDLEGKDLKKYIMKLSVRINGSIDSKDKIQYNHTYYFAKSEKGSVPEIDLYKDKTRVLRLILGPEYERIDQDQHKFYEIKGFQILAQNILDDDAVLFFATVIIKKYKSRFDAPYSKYFGSF